MNLRGKKRLDDILMQILGDGLRITLTEKFRVRTICVEVIFTELVSLRIILNKNIIIKIFSINIILFETVSTRNTFDRISLVNVVIIEGIYSTKLIG